MMEENAKKYLILGRNIKKARKAMGLSQNELAEKLDISREHLAKIETAKRGISLKLFFKTAEALKTLEKDLMDFKE